jgi:hypothetical protein
MPNNPTLEAKRPSLPRGELIPINEKRRPELPSGKSDDQRRWALISLLMCGFILAVRALEWLRP